MKPPVSRSSAVLCIMLAALAASATLSGMARAATPDDAARVQATVDALVRPLMAKYGIPGMAVAVTWNGRRYLYPYGVASRETGQPVSANTLFEIGSVSKTFTATLAAYAVETGKLKLDDRVARHIPALAGTPVGNASVLDLATHTVGLPLQVPDKIDTMPQYLRFLSAWRPAQAVGTTRVYSNNGIGLLGTITATALGAPFPEAMQRAVLGPLGLKQTYYRVPAERQGDDAQGYSARDVPIRMRGGLLWEEAYGVRTTAADLLRFAQANLGGDPADGPLQRAIRATHTAYFRAGDMGQALVWERYRYPVRLPALLAGNQAVLKALPVRPIQPPETGDGAAWLHKTGSTNGFSAYIALVPSQRIGVVVLANKAFPIDERVTVGYELISRLTGQLPSRDGRGEPAREDRQKSSASTS